MRTEKEMFQLILQIAKEDDRIRAVYMNGSRTNPNVEKDIFQDYDIVYVVKETKTFIENKEWINQFGKRLYMQYPEDTDSEEHKEKCYGWLIQFEDGNRLDLHIHAEDYAKGDIVKDKLCTILLDKDNILPEIPVSSDETHWVTKPTEDAFLYTCNEFWWCLNNVGKGLWREEIPYVQDMVNMVLRPQLVKMLSWKIGITTNFSCSIGKSGKYMWKWLNEKEWKQFLRTYAGGNIEEIWDSTQQMCQLFHHTALFVSEKLQFKYDKEEARASYSFFLHTKKLPKDATEIM